MENSKLGLIAEQHYVIEESSCAMATIATPTASPQQGTITMSQCLTTTKQFAILFYHDCTNFNPVLSLNVAPRDHRSINKSQPNFVEHVFVWSSLSRNFYESCDCWQLMMFEKRLSGEPVGFTVLGIFVIDQTTVLSVSTSPD
jgi:hypothetical protein